MAVKLNSTGGGSVTLDSPSTASNYTVTLPSAAGTLATTTGTGSVFTNPTINGFTGDTSAITIGTTQFVKDASGNIGIGTGTPLAKLSVGAGSLSDANVPIQISSASSAATWVGFNKAGAYGGLNGFSNAFSGLTLGLTIRSVTTDPIVFTVNNTLEAMYLNASGNLGLGVTPSAWGSYWKVIEGYGAVSLAVISNSVNPVEIGNNYYSVNSGFTSYYKSNGRATKYTCGDSGQHIWYNSNNVSGTAGAAWTPTQIMTLDASGNLGIGTSSVTANHRFTLKAPTSNYCQMSLIGGDTSNYCTLGTLNDSNVFFISQNGTERARIDSSGNFILTAAGSINLNTLNTYSSASSGYQKLPSGIIIQWGTTVFNGSGVASITFPTAFPTACRFVNASVSRGTTLSGYLMSTQIGSISTTGVTIIGNYTISGTVLTLGVNENAAWVAIGY